MLMLSKPAAYAMWYDRSASSAECRRPSGRRLFLRHRWSSQGLRSDLLLGKKDVGAQTFADDPVMFATRQLFQDLLVLPLHHFLDGAFDAVALEQIGLEQIGIVLLHRNHDVSTMEEMRDHMGIIQTAVLRLDME